MTPRAPAKPTYQSARTAASAPIAERDAIALLARALGTRAAGVEVGIGDDAAVLDVGRDKLVWTVDACVEGVHFDRRWLTLADVGWRATHAAVSDLAAMGARPVAALAGLVLPPRTTREELRTLGRGQAAAARALACPIVGGNISSGSELSVTTTVLGAASRPWLRSGARPGHVVSLVGDLGLAAAGLALLERGEVQSGTRAHARCLRAWRRPEARLEVVRLADAPVVAAIDVSDGLAGDAAHLARESGVRVMLEEPALRRALRPELLRTASDLALDPLELALRGGEDYAVLVVHPPGALALPRIGRIGRIEPGRGVRLELADGSSRPVVGGFEHGR